MIIALFIISLLIGYRAEENKRKIGGFWVFIFSVTFSPIIGLIISNFSEKQKENHKFISKDELKAKQKTRIVLGSVLFVLGLILIGMNYYKSQIDLLNDYSILYYPMVGVVFLGLYKILDKPTIQVKIDEKIKKVGTIETKASNHSNLYQEENYNEVVTHQKLVNMIPLFFNTLDDEQKIDFLDLYIQPKHDNPFNEGFNRIFPTFNFNLETNIAEYKKIIYCLDFNIDDEQTSEEKLLAFLCSIDSPLETFRMFSVIYAIKGDIKNSQIMLNNSLMAWKKTSIPINYSHLIMLTEVKTMIFLEKYDFLTENMKNYSDSFYEFYSKNPQFSLLENRFEEIM